MAKLSITPAWEETVAFVRREGRLLFPLVFMFVAFPGAVLEVLAPAGQRATEVPGWRLALIPVVLAIAMIGNIAVAYLALTPGSSVGEAIRRGARRFLALFGAGLLIIIPLMLLFILAFAVAAALVPGAMEAAATGQQSPAMITAIVIAVVILLPLAIYFGARLMLMYPITAAEAGGSLAIIRRSWSLTAGNAGKLVAFLLLFFILFVVVAVAIQSVVGLLFTLTVGPPRPGSPTAVLMALVSAVITTVVTVYFTSLVARIYAQLAGTPASEAFA